MTTRKTLYLLGSIIFLCLLVWQISAEAAPPYPPEIQQRIDGATKIICEIQTPRRVGTIAYLKQGKPWLVRIYTKDNEELEIWFNESTTSSFSLFFPDKIYYYENSAWLDQDALSYEEAKRLDRRLKFTGEEKAALKACLKTDVEEWRKQQKQ